MSDTALLPGYLASIPQSTFPISSFPAHDYSQTWLGSLSKAHRNKDDGRQAPCELWAAYIYFLLNTGIFIGEHEH